jgi:hypothetical protein
MELKKNIGIGELLLPPLSLIGLLAHHSYIRDIFPLAFAFFYSAVIKTKTKNW